MTRPVLLFACTWMIAKASENVVNIFKCEILRCILGMKGYVECMDDAKIFKSLLKGEARSIKQQG